MLIDPFGDMPSSLRGGIVAIGNFDGVHAGHCRLLALLRTRARQRGVAAVAVSFEPHPLQILRPESAPASLMTAERKAEVLLTSGADAVAILATTREFLGLSADDFFERIVREQFRAAGMVEGRNFGYGRGRAGTIETLAAECAQAGLSLDVIDIVTGEGATEISSSRVRRELAAGNVAAARSVLGRPHRVRGVVEAGDGRGRTIGFPTANLAYDPVLLPKDGVYAVRAKVRGRSFPAACNLGSNPTFGAHERKFEVHLIGCAEDLYGAEMDVDFLEHLRDVKPFAGVEALKAQLAVDIASARAIALADQPTYGCDLGQTISQWLALEVEPALAAHRVSFDSVQLGEGGVLRVAASAPVPLPPAVVLQLAGRLESDLRKVFGEVERLVWDGQPPGK